MAKTTLSEHSRISDKLGAIIEGVDTKAMPRRPSSIDDVPFRMKPVERETFQRQSYRKLREALMKGRFMPGDTVSLRGLARELGTSPMPIREAVRHLVAEKALQFGENRTFSVPLMTRAKLDELRKLRIILEGAVAEEGGKNIGERELLELYGLQDEMKSAVLRGDSKRYLTKNQDFHFLLYKSSSMSCAIDIIETLWLQIGPSFNLLLVGKKDRSAPATGSSSLTSHHDAILQALEQRKPAAVRRALEQDIYDGIEFLIQRTNG
jgi:DNA-binding GntR family transcriptional regulator